MADGLAESAPDAVIWSQGEVHAGSAFILPHDATMLCRTMAATSELPTPDAIVASFRSSFGVRRYVAQRTTSSSLRERGSMCGKRRGAAESRQGLEVPIRGRVGPSIIFYN